jgi:hypothetical protein
LLAALLALLAGRFEPAIPFVVDLLRASGEHISFGVI